MSNQNPSNPSRRRRIAGERRGSTGPAQDHTQETGPAPTQDTAPTEAPSQGLEVPHRSETRATPPTSSGAAGPARGIPGRVLIALGLVAAIAIGLAAYFWSESTEAEAVARTQTRAPAAAERAALAVLSYDHKTLEADKEKAVSFLTDAYEAKYVDTFALVEANADQAKPVVQAEVVASSVTRASPDQADVLLFVNQTTTKATAGGEPETALNRVTFDMREVDGTWLVDGITSY